MSVDHNRPMADDNLPFISSPSTPLVSTLRASKRVGAGHINTVHTDSQPLSQPIPQLPPLKLHRHELYDFLFTFHDTGLLEKGLPRPHMAPSKPSTPYPEEKPPQTPSPTHPNLPPKQHHTITRHILYKILSVYQRVFSFIFLLNMAAIAYYMIKKPSAINPNTLSTWSSTNFLLAILVRQDFCINLLFRSAWLIPWKTPLRLRRLIARVYTYGGIHTGAAVAGTAWWLFYAFVITKTYILEEQHEIEQLPLVILAWLILLVLFIIILFACPHSRRISHNLFELSHRFGGWILLLLLWISLTLSLNNAHNKSSTIPIPILFLKTPAWWNLMLMTAMILHPWLHLRRWTFTPEKLSPHALRLHFNESLHRFSCLSISSDPLREWHPFATFPAPDNAPGGSMVISNAGDWTRNMIASPQTKYWVKGSPRAGVLSLSCIFKRVVIVTTGSGIGPCLSSVIDKPASQICRVVWSTRSPADTYGDNITSWLQQIDPGAVVIDTDVQGRPDLVALAWKMYKDIDAEAVFVLSNRDVTGRVVYALESRGVPAYGPIWDS